MNKCQYKKQANKISEPCTQCHKALGPKIVGIWEFASVQMLGKDHIHGKKVKFQEWWEMKLIVPKAANLFVFTR
jgi:hypothetical protein